MSRKKDMHVMHLVGKPNSKHHLADLEANRRVFKRTLEKQTVIFRLVVSGLGLDILAR